MQCQFLIKNISLEIMNSTKLHHQYFAGLLQFPEIFGNCNMPRPKGSVNKRIHFSSIDILNAQLIYDKRKFDSSEFEPDHWFYRLKNISRNLPYIIALNSKASMNDFVFSNHVDANLEYINQNEGLGFITKPGGRKNDRLMEDIQEFMASLLEWYSNKFEDNPDSSLSSKKSLNNLRAIAISSLRDVENDRFKRLFLLHCAGESKLKIVKPDIDIHSTADLDINIEWKNSWVQFWQLMIEQLETNMHFFGSPSFQMKENISIKSKKFQIWANQGITEFLDPVNVKLTDEVMLIRYLKKALLGNPSTKK